MKNIIIVVIAVFGCALNACKQSDPKTEAPRVAMSGQRLKDAIAIQVGSYFVYQDSASKAIDSLSVVSYYPPSYVYNLTATTWYEGGYYRAASFDIDPNDGSTMDISASH